MIRVFGILISLAVNFSDLIRDGLNAKLSMIPEAARVRLQDILTKLVNKGKGNVIAIVL